MIQFSHVFNRNLPAALFIALLALGCFDPNPPARGAIMPIYPNPFKDQFSVDLGAFLNPDLSLVLEIQDDRGKSIITIEEPKRDEPISISLAGKKKGAYVVKATYEGFPYLQTVYKVD